MPRTPKPVVSRKQLAANRANAAQSALGEGFHRLVQQSNSWSLAIRYHAQAERHLRRAVEEFERLKAPRPELPNEPVCDPQPEPKETTCTPENDPISPPVGQTPASAAGPLASLVLHENYLARAVEPRQLEKGVWGRLITRGASLLTATAAFQPAPCLRQPSTPAPHAGGAAISHNQSFGVHARSSLFAVPHPE